MQSIFLVLDKVSEAFAGRAANVVLRVSAPSDAEEDEESGEIAVPFCTSAQFFHNCLLHRSLRIAFWRLCADEAPLRTLCVPAVVEAEQLTEKSLLWHGHAVRIERAPRNPVEGAAVMGDEEDSAHG